ncbi:MAG TPA: TonB-dependent receptor [Sphingobium sp.]
MIKGFSVTRLAVTTSLLALTALSSGAHASDAAPAASTDEAGVGEADIVVTAQKRSERLRDVPMSITALGTEQLSRANVVRTADLAKFVPGLTYSESISALPIYNIRGIGFQSDSAASAPTVSVYNDQVPLPYAAMARGSTLDLERVEVLKGPQGTLFGQNSTGGAINYIAARPTDQLSAGLDLTYQRFNEVDAQGFISDRLSDDVGIRLSFRTEHRFDGWQRTYIPGDDRTLGEKHFTTGRLLLDWNVGSKLKLTFNANGWIDKSDSIAAQLIRYAPTVTPPPPEQAAILSVFPPAPRNWRAAQWNADQNLRRDNNYFQLSLRADWELSDQLLLTSITAYQELNMFEPRDIDGTNFSNIYPTSIVDTQNFSQELRLSGSLDRVKWMLGANYAHDRANESRVFVDFFGSNAKIGPFPLDNFDEQNDQKVETIAAFGSIDVNLTDSLVAQGSMRYTQSNNDHLGCLFDNGDGHMAAAISLITGGPIPAGACVTLLPGFTPAITSIPSKLNEDSLSWRTGLSWKSGNEVLLYANVTKGYKAGSFYIIPALSVNQLTPVRQESVMAYEAGFRFTPVPRLHFDGAAFYYDYKGKQLSGFVATGFPFGNLPALIAIPKSHVVGGEASVTWQAASGLRLLGSATYSRSKVDSDFFTSDPLGLAINLKGQPFANTPKWGLLADAEYRFDVGSGMQAYFGGNVSYRSQTYSVVGKSPEFKLPSYALTDLRAGLEKDRWRLQVFGQNVFNVQYPVAVFVGVDTVAKQAGFGATYGVTIGYKF